MYLVVLPALQNPALIDQPVPVPVLDKRGVDVRAKPYLGVLAAGPLEDVLSYHGPAFIG